MAKSKLRSPVGMAVIASVGGPDPADAPRASHDEIRAIPASDRQHQFECGHVGPKRYDLDLFGQVMKNSGETPRKCGKCLEDHLRRDVARCAVCGLVIFPGEGVAVYAPDSDFPSAWVTEVDGGVIGCLRMSCCPSGGFFAGHWTTEGFLPLMPEDSAIGTFSLPPGFFPPPRPPWYRRWFPWLFS